MSVFFRPYEGKRPYVFISYSHRDSERVLDLLTELDRRKLRLWYDEGIPAGSDWPMNIDLHMRGSAAVLFFLSGTALDSPNCFSEIKTAAVLRKPILIVRLDDAAPDRYWKPLFERAEILTFPCGGTEPVGIRPWSEVQTQLPPVGEPTANEILQWKRLRRSFFRKWTDRIRGEWIGAAVALALLAAAALGLTALLRGRFDPPAASTPAPTAAPTQAITPTPGAVPTPTIDPGYFPVTLPDAQQDAAVRSILGKEKDDVILRPELAELKELYFCGHMVLRSADGIAYAADGAVKVGTATVIEGKVSDLSAIGTMAFLVRLALIRQPLQSLSPLNDLVLLKELWLSGNALSDVSGLTGLSSLETLHLEHTKVTDLTPLEALPSLRTVTVSADMLPLTWTENKPFRVILVP